MSWQACACGVPSVATHHVSYVVTRTLGDLMTETSDVDLYYCAEHVPESWEVTEYFHNQTPDTEASEVEITCMR